MSVSRACAVPIGLAQGVVENPDEEENSRHVHDELQSRVADDVSCFEAEDAEQWEHPERMDEVRERLRCVVRLHNPPEMDVKCLAGLEHIGSFDQPLAA